jgi:hypothetical protein
MTQEISRKKKVTLAGISSVLLVAALWHSKFNPKKAFEELKRFIRTKAKKTLVSSLLFFIALWNYKDNAIGAPKISKDVKRLTGHLPIIGSLPLVLFKLDRYKILI